MTCPCNDTKRKMPGCDAGTPPVLEVSCGETPVLFHTVTIPASIGDVETVPPTPGAYRNTRVFYEVDNVSYLYDSDGIPQLLSGGTTGVMSVNGQTGNVIIPDATTSAKGLMSAADKTKLDNLQVGLPFPSGEVITNYGTISATTTITPTVNCFVTGKAVVLSNGGAAEISTTDNTFIAGTPYFGTGATNPNLQQGFCVLMRANQGYTFRISGTARFEQVRTMKIAYA